MLTRRTTLTALALATAVPSLWANPLIAVDVVKIMSFSCSFCLNAESFDRALAQAAQETGGRFIRAPVPSVDEDTGAMARLYYAARDMNPALAETVKDSIYKGAQDVGVPLYNFMQIYAWITQDLPAQEAQFAELFKRAQDLPTQAALERAVALATNAGVQALPTYILLVDGVIKTVLDSSAAPGGSLSGLRNLVSSNIELLSKN